MLVENISDSGTMANQCKNGSVRETQPREDSVPDKEPTFKPNSHKKPVAAENDNHKFQTGEPRP